VPKVKGEPERVFFFAHVRTSLSRESNVNVRHRGRRDNFTRLDNLVIGRGTTVHIIFSPVLLLLLCTRNIFSRAYDILRSLYVVPSRAPRIYYTSGDVTKYAPAARDENSNGSVFCFRQLLLLHTHTHTHTHLGNDYRHSSSRSDRSNKNSDDGTIATEPTNCLQSVVERWTESYG